MKKSPKNLLLQSGEMTKFILNVVFPNIEETRSMNSKKTRQKLGSVMRWLITRFFKTPMYSKWVKIGPISKTCAECCYVTGPNFFLVFRVYRACFHDVWKNISHLTCLWQKFCLDFLIYHAAYFHQGWGFIKTNIWWLIFLCLLTKIIFIKWVKNEVKILIANMLEKFKTKNHKFRFYWKFTPN